MRVRDLGEFRLIDRLAGHVAAAEAARPPRPSGATALLLGIGDDAAAWTSGATTELLTTDTLVQGVHFTPRTSGWHDLGWKAMAVNVSDIAAMGGMPTYAAVTLGLPPGTPAGDVDALYAGMLEACAEYGPTIVGGDVVRSPVAFVTVALAGVAERPLMLRSRARPGDVVAVTGSLGASGAGLALLQGRGGRAPSGYGALLAAHRRPRPRLAEGLVLRSGGVRCAMDVSDGLVADLAKLCLASGVAARVEAHRVPVHPEAAAAFPGEALALALGAGEDYELLFTAAPPLASALLERLPAGGSVIGQVVQGEAGRVDVTDRDGHAVEVPAVGWDHLRP